MKDFFSLSEKKKAAIVAKFNKYINKKGPGGCWVWTGVLNNYGYGRICLLKFDMLAHRFAWMLRYSCPIPKGLHCIHSCDRRNCIRPEHIALGTNEQNQRDRILKDRSKLKPLAERLKIVEALSKGERLYKVAEKFNIGRATVGRYRDSKEIIAVYGKL